MKALTFTLIAASFAATALSHGAVLYSIDWGNRAISTPRDYDASAVTVTTAANTTGTAATSFPGVSMNRFFNNDSVGWLTIQSGPGDFAINSQGNLNQEYFTFTVSANAGNTLNLTSLDFLARMATTNNGTVRGLEVWATTNGGPFSFATGTPAFQLNSLTTDRNSSGTAISIDLSGAQYQNANSITFRVFNPGTTGFHGLDLGDFTLNGTVIPEPSVALLGGLGLLGLLRRRRV